MKKFLKFILFVLIIFGISILAGMHLNDISNFITNIKSNNLSSNQVTNNTVSNTINIQTASDNTLNNNENNQALTNKSFSLTAVGDIMCHNSQYKDALQSDGTYDFSYVFEDIYSYLNSSDLTIGNLETTFAGADRGYSNYPTFNSPEHLAVDLKEAGFDILTTANNHCMDTGYTGLCSTLDYLDENEIAHTGTFRTEEEKNTILIKNVNDLKIAFLSFTYGTNGISIPTDKEFSVNLSTNENILEQIDLAKKESPDIIITCIHWGTEYQKTPNSSQEELENLLFQNGVDIIIGSHPHVLQTCKQKTITLEDGTEKDVFVMYSMGNFMSGQTQDYTRTSIILTLKITKDYNNNGKLIFDEISYRPIYTYTKSNYKGYEILDMIKAVDKFNKGESSISKTNYTLFNSEIERLQNLFQN